MLIAKRDFQRLAEQAQRQSEDDYWTQAALDAEAKARSKKLKPIPFEDIERELGALRSPRRSVIRKAR